MKKVYLIIFSAMVFLITACAEQNPNEDLYGSSNPSEPNYSAGHYVLDNSSIFNGGISAGVNASITNVSQEYYDKLVVDNKTEDKLLIQHDFEDFGNRNFNLLYRWGKSIVFDGDINKHYPHIEGANSETRPGRVNSVIIPKPELLERQNTIPVVTMPGVSFPHETHRHVLAGMNFMGKDGKHFIPISGCAVCHSIDTENGKVASTGFHAYETPAAIFMQHNLTRANKTISGYSTETNPAHDFCWNSCHTKIAEPTVAPKTTDCNTCHRIQRSGKVEYPTPTVQ